MINRKIKIGNLQYKTINYEDKKSQLKIISQNHQSIQNLKNKLAHIQIQGNLQKRFNYNIQSEKLLN